MTVSAPLSNARRLVGEALNSLHTFVEEDGERYRVAEAISSLHRIRDELDALNQGAGAE